MGARLGTCHDTCLRLAGADYLLWYRRAVPRVCVAPKRPFSFIAIPPSSAERDNAAMHCFYSGMALYKSIDILLIIDGSNSAFYPKTSEQFVYKDFLDLAVWYGSAQKASQSLFLALAR